LIIIKIKKINFLILTTNIILIMKKNRIYKIFKIQKIIN
jgi:hypothetical protein